MTTTPTDGSPDPHLRPLGMPERGIAWVGTVWGLLFVNALGSAGPDTILPLPRPVFQLVAVGALVLAFFIAAALNPRTEIRPSAYLMTLAILVLTSMLASAQRTMGPDAAFRCIRFTVFMMTLWLLTRWWRHPLLLVRAHIRALAVVLATIAVGLLVAPGTARPSSYEGRLVGTLWPLSAPQVGQFAAVAAGLVVVLWLCRQIDGRSVLLIALPAVALLMLSHTRTAVLGLLIGLAIAGISLFPTSGRARRFVSVAGLLCAFAAIALGSVLQTWFQRGQSDGDFSNLTGRQKVWDALVATPRSGEQRLLGIGLTDKSFGGLPIDSSWLAVYHEQGLVGLTLVGLGLLVLVVTAVLRPPSAGRSCALFLIAYCLTSSYTECGLGDASPYILHLTLAAALLSGQRTAADHSPGQPLPAARRTPRWTKGATA